MKLAVGLRLRPVLDVAIPGLYAWVVTVIVPIHQKDAHGWPLILAWLGIICLAATSGLVATHWRSWSAVSVAMFIMASAGVWFLIAPFEVTLGFLGTLGWASFAIGWVRAAETSVVLSGKAAQRIDLSARYQLPLPSWLMLGTGLVGSLAALALAWNIEGRERAVLGQAVAVLGALVLMTAASTAASAVGRQAAAIELSRGQVIRTLFLLSLFVLGCWLTLTRA